MCACVCVCVCVCQGDYGVDHYQSDDGDMGGDGDGDMGGDLGAF